MTDRVDQVFDTVGRAWRFTTRPYRAWRAVATSLETPVGLTPRQEIWSLNKTRLYRYTPVVPP